MITNSNFRPPWWLAGAHGQTVWHKLRRKIEINTRRERVELPDGDFIDLDWAGAEEGPLVLILHGLEGSIESHYTRGLMKKMQQCGWRTVLMHFRGCSGEPNRLVRAYHSGDTGDVDYIVNLLCARQPHVELYVVGYSMGGSVLLKWLGESQVKPNIKACVAVSVPFELHKAANRVRTGLSRMYQWHLLNSMKGSMSRKFTIIEPHIKVDNLEDLNDFYTFDTHVTAPLHGFQDADDYYSQSSCRRFLKNIQVPTLILQAEDDPFMTPDVIPEERELSDAITLEISKRGGHLGFISGDWPWSATYWLEDRIPEYLTDQKTKDKT